MVQTLLTKQAVRPRSIAINASIIWLSTSLAVSPAIAQQYVVPVVQQPIRVPVNRIQAPGYVPPPPVVRRPWWFTVQTVSGPGAVVPIARVTNYRPQPFRFQANAPVLAGKPILPPEGTPPAQWAAAPAITPSPPSLPPVAATPPPVPAVARQPAPVQPPPVSAPTLAAPSGQWATVAIDASQPQPNAMAVTIPATPGALLAATPPTPTVSTRPVSQSVTAAPDQPSTSAAVAWWRCIGVTDGDTLTCLDESGRQQKLVLAGIDAPEPGQPYGRESRESLAELVFGKQIAVVAISRDTAGLAICQVSVDGRDVSAALVAAGAAWADPATGTSLTPEQQEAQQGRKGLWAEDNPQPPWEFRETGNAPWQPSA